MSQIGLKFPNDFGRREGMKTILLIGEYSRGAAWNSRNQEYRTGAARRRKIIEEKYSRLPDGAAPPNPSQRVERSRPAKRPRARLHPEALRFRRRAARMAETQPS
jgi:hypothetical protein